MNGHYYPYLYDPEAEITEQGEITEEEYDEYVVIRVIISMNGGYGEVKMIGRKRDADRNPIGEWNKNNFWTRFFLSFILMTVHSMSMQLI